MGIVSDGWAWVRGIARGWFAPSKDRVALAKEVVNKIMRTWEQYQNARKELAQLITAAQKAHVEPKKATVEQWFDREKVLADNTTRRLALEARVDSTGYALRSLQSDFFSVGFQPNVWYIQGDFGIIYTHSDGLTVKPASEIN